METVSKVINDSIVEIYERDYPFLCDLIKTLISKGETFKRFESRMKEQHPDWQTSITYSACLTLFKHYKSN